jgi:hypothetical protein
LLEEVASQIRQVGGNALVVTADVANPEDMHRLMRATLARSARSTSGSTTPGLARSAALKTFRWRIIRG